MVSARTRYKIFVRDNFTCQYCGQNISDDENIKLEVEHVIPKSKGGTDTFNNLVTSCFRCNRGKYSDSPIVFTTKHTTISKTSKGMNFYSNFQEFCEKNQLSKAEAIKILEDKLKVMRLKNTIKIEVDE